MKKTALVTVLSLSLTASSFAAKGAGTTGSPFLKVPVSGRAAALAGAVGSTTGDIDNLDFNPAAINGIERIDLMATYVKYFEDTSLQAASVGLPIQFGGRPKHEVMQGAEFVPQQMVVGFQYRQFQAEDTARSSLLGVKGEKFDIKSQLLELALAYPITARVGIGAAAKLITDKVESKTAKSNAGDLGVTAKLSSRWTIAAAVQNLGSSGKFETKSDPLPRQTRASASYNDRRWMALADVAAGNDGVVRTSAGVELSVGPILRLRGGAYHDTDMEFTGGIGLRLKGPQKARKPAMQPPSRQAKTANTSPLSTLAQTLIEHSAEKLITTAVDSKLLITPSPIAIYPLNSKDATGSTLSDSYTSVFKKSKDFAVLSSNNRDHSDTMLVGNVEDQEETLIVTTRLLIADTADTVATDRFEINKDDLFVKKKMTLDSVPTQPASSSSADVTFSSLDLGLDYGLSTHKDLGITHTVSLRLLY